MANNSPIDQQWEAIQRRVTEALTSNFPMEGKRNKLVLNSPLTVDDRTVDHEDLKSQEDAKLMGRTWGAPVLADVSLIDKETGQQLDRTKIKLLTLPKPTQRYSYIVDGNEWQVDNLWRLRSGVYAHIKQNGELQAEFNLKEPFAKSPRLYIPFSPEKKQFKLKYESSNFPLYSILKTLGVPDEDMKKQWGEAIYKANSVSQARIDKDINSLYAKLSTKGVKADGDTLQHKAQAIIETFHNSELIPETTKATLGKPMDHVNGEALLLASKRILEVARGDIPPDDRDSLVFKELHSIDDFLHDTLTKYKTQRSLHQKIGHNIDRQVKVRDIMSGDLFSRPIVEFFSKDTLSRNPEQINPLEMMSNHRATTIIAPDMGGIKNERSVTGDMTLINPSHLGFLDPIFTPECYDEETEVYTSKGWKKWPTVTYSDYFACRIGGRLEFHVPDKLHSSQYEGKMYGAKNGKIDYLVTPDHRMYVRPFYSEHSTFSIKTAAEIHGKPRTFAAGHQPYEGTPKATDKETSEFFELPIVLGNNSSKNVECIPMKDWAEFIGWFLSEGCVTYKEETSSYLVRIAQTQAVNPEECEKIEALLNRLPWKWCQDSPKTSYAIGVKQLAHYLKDFGHAQNKYIPEYLFWTSVEARENLLECLLLGDGRINSQRATGKSYRQQVYCTTSSRLALDVERLAISLGHSVRVSCYTDDREERYLDIFEVRLLRHTERHALPKKGHYYIKQYSGMVYCASVPGGLLLVRRNGSVPIWLGNSEKTGITLHLPLGVKKEGNEAKTMVYDLKDGKIRHVNPAELHSEHIVLPDQVKWANQKPVPIHATVKMKDPRSHEIVEKPFSDGRFLLLTAHQLFAEATNLIPFLQNNQGNRTMTAARQATQAVGLLHREAPLVQVRSGSGHSWEKVIGSPWTQKASTAGKVVEIVKNPHNGHADAIIIQDSKGQKHPQQLYNHFPLNDSKSFMHSTPSVKVGDKVDKGQILADSNYTRDGNLALGTNLRVTYLPYKGYNFEDGIVISESAAQKLTSEHVHRKSIEIDPDKDFVDKKKFISYASTASKKLSSEQMSKLGDDGIIHVGTKVDPGDILVAAVGKKDLVGETARMIGRLDKKMFAFQDKSVTWDSQHAGEVVKVVKNPNGKGATVFVKTLEPAEIGDKMVGRHGNKGIITRILPNGEMPRIGGPDGQHTEVLMNPSGVPTRLNLGQMLETASSKIAIKTGKPYLVQNFGGADEDYSEKIKNELKKHGLHDEDDMYDAPTGNKLGSALNGHQYILKLKHQVEKKLAVRGAGNPRYEYALDRSPKGTGANFPGQAIGQLEFYALLAHGARHNLREMATYKAEQHLGPNNDPNEHIDFWQRVQTGQPIPPPQIPFAYKKFEAMLTGLGINVKKQGHQLVLQPLTDKGVLALSAGEIIDPGRVLRGKDAKELEKGLFDPKVTGGLPNDVGKGLKWSHITLPEPIPNPIFVGNKQHPGPAVSLSGMKFDDFEKVARGQQQIKTPSGEMKTGGRAIQDILAAIQIKPEIKRLRERLPKLRGSELDKDNRKLKYLLALDELGMKPNEAYVMKYIPVLPPIFRPIVPMQDGSLRYDDINHYYKSLGHIIKQYKEAPKELGEEGVKELREEMYDVTRSLAGLAGGTPVYDSNRQMKGLLDTISGNQPKEGYFQKRLMKRRQDLSMRSTIIPEPAMHLDHVGLPKDAAMELYKPFVVREMQSLGYSPIEALKEIKTGSNLAWRALQGAMDKRPVMLKRDPALHKFSIMAFKPKIVEGKAIKIHPLVTAGYNADFDGDSVDLDTPIPLTIEGKLVLKTGRELLSLLSVGDGNYVAETKNIEALTYNGWRPVKTISFHEVKDKKKYRIILKNGISFIVSEDHSVMVNREERKPTQLTVGVEVDHRQLELNKTRDLWEGGRYEGGVIHGHFLGDGCAELRETGGGRVTLACKPHIESLYLQELWKKHLDVHIYDNEKHGYFQISRKDIAEHFLASFGRYAAGKAILGAVGAPLDYLRGLLAGYILADGSVELTKSGSYLVRTWSRSKKLRDQMSLVANILGLSHSCRERTAKGEINYIISFGKEAIKMMDYRCPGKKGDLIKQARYDYENERNDDRSSQSERGYEIKSIEEVVYNDRMIDIEVDDESHVFAIHGGVILHNTMSAFVPLTDDAVRETFKMFPSNNLFSSTNGGIMYAPEQESFLGLHLMSRWGKESGKSFPNFQEALKAKERGQLHVTDGITINGHKTTLGRAMIAQHLPEAVKADETLNKNFQDPGFELHKKDVHEILKTIAKHDPKSFSFTVDHLKDLGNQYSYELGFSFGLKDIGAHKSIRDPIIKRSDVEANKVKADKKLTPAQQHDKLVDIYTAATKELIDAHRPIFKKEDNNMYRMVSSGARGKMEQFRQMTIAPMLMKDGAGNTLATPVRKSYSEGLDVGDYWTSLHGARMGTLQRVEGTSEPGRLTKEIVNVVIPTMIVSRDCGTAQGIHMDIHDSDIHDRYLAAAVKLPNDQSIQVGTLIDGHITSTLQKNKIKQVVVRSPLKCAHGQGLCSKCFGLNENGDLHEIGTNIGVLAGHALGEPATQLAMDCNAAGNIITVKYKGEKTTLTLEQLWNKVDSLVDEDDGVETKVLDDFLILDHKKLVPARMMQRHKPHSDMVLVRLESGHSFVCQATHPNWARLDHPICPKCGDDEPVIFVGHYKTGPKTTVRCASCRKSYSVDRKIYEDQQERIIRSSDLEGSYLGVTRHGYEPGKLVESEEKPCAMPLPPYLLGIYLAEGNVRRTKLGPDSVENGQKPKQRTSPGLHWKTLGAVITQNPGDIREYIKQQLTSAGLDFTEPSETHIQLNDVCLANKLGGLCGIGSHNKTLPTGWLMQSWNWKLEFLAGLLDGDGTLAPGHTVALDTTSWALASQVQEIVRSLNGKAVVYASTNKELSRHQCYRITIDLAQNIPSIKELPPAASLAPLEYASYSKVVQVKKIEFYTDWTYDFATDSRGFTVNGIRTHNSFHTGGVAASRGGASVDKFTRLNQLLELPKVLPNAAILAKISGKVTKVERDMATNGWNVHIGKDNHYIPAKRTPTYEGQPLVSGVEVKKGDPISDGHIDPREYLEHTDIHTVQNHLTNELYNGIYKDERVRRRNIETVVRAMTNYTKVTDPGDSHYIHGDRMHRTVADEYNRNLPVGGNPLVHRPLLKGMHQMALDSHEDWMARLNFEQLRNTLLEGTAKGWKTDLHGNNPIAAYAFGSEFGLGTPDKKHHY